MAKQIILTQNNFGIPIELQFVSNTNSPVDLTDKTVEVAISYDGTIIDVLQATISSYTNGTAYIITTKKHTSNVGLYTTFWSVKDKYGYITAQSDLYYYVKEEYNGASSTGQDKGTVEEKFDKVNSYIETLVEENSGISTRVSDIETINTRLTNNIKTINSQLDNKANKNDIKTINSQLDTIASVYIIDNLKWNINNNNANEENTTNGINNALKFASDNNYNKVVLTEGVYSIKSMFNDTIKPTKTDGIIIPSNIHFYSNNAELRIKKNSSPCYCIFNLKNKKNIKIENFKITGDREEHIYNQEVSKKTHEFGFGIGVFDNCKNIEIINNDIELFTGDGIIVQGKNTENITIKGNTLDSNRRNNIALVDGELIKVEKNNILNGGKNLINSQGVLPSFGIDIEGYREIGLESNECPRKITIIQNIFKGNRLQACTNYNGEDIEISNNYSDGTISLGFGRNCKIINNIIEGNGSIRGIDSLPNAKTFTTEGNVVRGNIINNCSEGISIQHNNVSITDNKINSTIGINIYGAISDYILIKNNEIKSGNIGIQSISGNYSLFLENNKINSTNNVLKLDNNYCKIANNSLSTDTADITLNSNSCDFLNNTIDYLKSFNISATTKINIKDNLFKNIYGYAPFNTLNKKQCRLVIENNIFYTTSSILLSLTSYKDSFFHVVNNRIIYKGETNGVRAINLAINEEEINISTLISNNVISSDTNFKYSNSIYSPAILSTQKMTVVNNIINSPVNLGENVTNQNNIVI